MDNQRGDRAEQSLANVSSPSLSAQLWNELRSAYQPPQPGRSSGGDESSSLHIPDIFPKDSGAASTKLQGGNRFDGSGTSTMTHEGNSFTSDVTGSAPDTGPFKPTAAPAGSGDGATAIQGGKPSGGNRATEIQLGKLSGGDGATAMQGGKPSGGDGATAMQGTQPSGGDGAAAMQGGQPSGGEQSMNSSNGGSSDQSGNGSGGADRHKHHHKHHHHKTDINLNPGGED